MREFHRDWTEKQYRDDPRWSSSAIRCMANYGPPMVKVAYIDRSTPHKDTDAMRLGRVFHLAMAFPDEWKSKCFIFSGKFEDDELHEQIAKEFKGRTKASLEVGAELDFAIKAHRAYRDAKLEDAKKNGLEYFPSSEMEKLERMVQSVYDNPAALDYIGHRKIEHVELPVTNIGHYGLPTKALLDFYDGDVIVDYKTTKCHTAEDFLRDALKKGYHFQADHYEATAECSEFRFITVRNEEPYESMVYNPAPLMEEARKGNKLYMYAIWECVENDCWTSLYHGAEIPMNDPYKVKIAR